MEKVALITGITGQDGAYLAEYLLSKNYIVHGIKRRSSLFNTQRIDHLYQDKHELNTKLFLHYGDLTDSSNIIRIIKETQPDEIYNLAAMSHVHVSFEIPEYTSDVVALGTLRILDAIRLLGLKKTRIYQASTSELFGRVAEVPQRETTPFYPRSPYAVAKMYAYWITINYREAYGLYACNGILFNHESPIRGETFVTRKITRAVARIALNLQRKLYLGNLNAQRDWGHAKDYVRAMYLMLQQPVPDDYVIATGIGKTVREFVQHAFLTLGIIIEFRENGLKEKAIIAAIYKDVLETRIGDSVNHLQVGQEVIEVDPEYFRPTEVDALLGDASKAFTNLGWKPQYSFEDLVSEMMSKDISFFKQQKLLKEHGHELVKSYEDRYHE